MLEDGLVCAVLVLHLYIGMIYLLVLELEDFAIYCQCYCWFFYEHCRDVGLEGCFFGGTGDLYEVFAVYSHLALSGGDSLQVSDHNNQCLVLNDAQVDIVAVDVVKYDLG